MNFKTLSAFFAVYFIWGSTYLAIRYGIDTIPPALLSSFRFLAAGGLMLLAALALREKRITRNQLKLGALSGILLIFSNALVCIVELRLPSGLCALVIGLVPVWIMLFSWWFFGGIRPTLFKLLGAGLGIGGIALIAWDNLQLEGADASLWPYSLLGFACILWAFGTLVQRQLKDLSSPLLFSAVQMLSGAAFVCIVALIRGETQAFDPWAISRDSWLALLYLIVFGSLIAFSAYSWLSRNVESHLVSTYALVNPIVAAALGILIADEPFTLHFLLGLILVLVALSMILKRTQPRAQLAKV